MTQDVVINGTTYPAVETVALTDANGNTTMYYPDAVRYAPQELTEEQKAQARENIGITGTAETADSVEILLPSEAVAVVGVEFNIYHKSIIRASKSLDNYDIKCYLNDSSVTCRRYAECFRLTAETGNIGDYTLTVEVRNLKDYAVIVSKSMVLHVVENRTISGKNVLFIGDSLTFSRAGLYVAEIQYNLSNGGIVSIGSQDGSGDINQVGNVKHEGYNGATCGGFLREKVTNAFTNPFYNPTSGTFDLAYFMTNHGYSGVDAVCLNLGHNNLGNEVAGVADLKTIVEKIHAYNPNIPVIISLITPLGDQNSHAHQGFSAGQMRFHWRQLIKAYIDAFDNKISNVYLSTPYFNVDPENDFPVETVARCARDSAEIVRQNDSHPTRIGTLKMADSYYANLLYRIPDTAEIYYTVTNNLTNVTNSNSTSAIKEGTSYTATLTANSGYELDTVSVTMGGQTVTVTNGVIDIASVTGDIVITATAKAESTVTNLVDPSTATSSPDTSTLFKDEWLNGYYLSAAAISAKSGCIVTDLFPIDYAQTIKVEGVLLDTVEHKNRFRWYLFDAEGNKPFGSYINFAADENTNTAGTAIIDVDNNTIIIDLSAAMNTNNAYMKYARFSCYPAGANEDIVVSVVE